MRRFENKVVIVTGGGGGIGEATVLRFAAEGAAVAVADVNGEAAERVADAVRATGAKAIAVVGDVSEEAEVKRMVAETVQAFGGLDVLHNNAAAVSDEIVAGDGDLVDLEQELIDKVMAVNLRGPIFLCKHAIPHMIERGGGAILNTSSIAAIRGLPGVPVYAASKAALASLTRSVATQYGKQGIRCNTVAPGTTMVPRAIAKYDEDTVAQALGAVLTTRLGEPKDIAAVVVFLASEDAAYITGHEIVADGGQTIHI